MRSSNTALPGYEPGESAPERPDRSPPRARRAARTGPAASVKIGRRTVRIDLAYPDAGIAIEYDGWAFHSTRSALSIVTGRAANDLVLLGMQMLRFTSTSTRRSDRRHRAHRPPPSKCQLTTTGTRLVTLARVVGGCGRSRGVRRCSRRRGGRGARRRGRCRRRRGGRRPGATRWSSRGSRGARTRDCRRGARRGCA